MMKESRTVFETMRLTVRTAVTEDAALYHALWTNPQVMKNMGFPNGLPITLAEVEEKIRNQEDIVWGHLLVAVLKGTGERIGECKLYLPDENGISETDVKLLPAYWGHKYGVEIKRGLVDYLFRHTKCTAVQATPNVNNIASIKMQEAVGGVRVGEKIAEFPESMRDYTCPVHHYIYHVRRQDWQKAQPEPT